MKLIRCDSCGATYGEYDVDAPDVQEPCHIDTINGKCNGVLAHYERVEPQAVSHESLTERWRSRDKRAPGLD